MGLLLGLLLDNLALALPVGAVLGILGGASKGKLWETYLQRWDAKVEAGEHGMLDAFLEAFAKHYAAAVGRAGD